MSSERVLVIGAGPFGLSTSAHLSAIGVDHRVVGKPMDTWRSHMPPGMKLRSEPYGSDLAAPQTGFDVGAFCACGDGRPYVDRVGPLSIEDFLDYTDWYTKELVPEIDDVSVSEISPSSQGFEVSFSDGSTMRSRGVVVATGLLPFAVMPEELSGFPRDLVSHASDHHELDHFAGRRVAVVGGGQSALETAALLHESGASVQIVMRRPTIHWLEPNPEQVTRLGQIRRPVNKLGEGWKCTFWNTPAAFRRLPTDVRIEKARIALGPAGAWWLRDRVEGRVEVLPGHRIREATATGSGVRLTFGGLTRTSLDVDHVVAATGFRVDLARLPFVSESLRPRIVARGNYPMVTRAGESSVSGLYFAGAMTAASIGPSVRFIAGTHNVADRLARSIQRHRF